MRLAAALEAAIGDGVAVRASVRCDRCGESVEGDWVGSWTRVEVECSLGSRRPDIALFQEQEVVGAIEVRATHGVDERKRGDLEEMEVGWVEVLADERMLEPLPGWTVEAPLEADAASFAWRCDSCRDAERRLEQSRLDQEEFERSSLVRRRAFVEMCVAEAESAWQDGLVAIWTRTVVLQYSHGRRSNYMHFALAMNRSGGADTGVSLYRIRSVKRPLFTICPPLSDPRQVQQRADDAVRKVVKRGREASVDWGVWRPDCMRVVTAEEVRALVSQGFEDWCERSQFPISRVGYHVAIAAYEESLRRDVGQSRR